MPTKSLKPPASTSVFTEVGIPSLGMDTDTVPRLLPTTKASEISNFLMDRPGVLPMRGPLCEGTAWDAGSGIAPVGQWVFDDTVLLSRYAASATAIKDYWTTPYRKATAAGQLRGLNLTSRLVDIAGNTSSNLAAANADGVPGLKSVRVGPYVYGPGGDATANVTQNGFLYKKTKFLKWDGSATPTVYTHGPQCSQDIVYHYNRLFMLGGIPEGGTVIGFNSLYWSDPLPTDGTALPDTAAAWQDDVSGLVNQIVIGASDDSDFGVALAHVGPNLLILKRRSLWMLYGNQPANFAVKQVDNEVGCLDPRSVVEYGGGVFFMAERGFMYFDGSRARPVSQGLNSSLVANVLKYIGRTGLSGGYCRAALLDRGYILVASGVVDGSTLAASVDYHAWLLHAPTGAWTQLSAGFATFVGGGRTTNNTYLTTDQKLVKANYLFNPPAAPAGTRGFDSIDGGATKAIIPATVTLRALPLATPPTESRLQRVLLDYYWSLANGGWDVNVATSAGDLIGATFGVPSRSPIIPARGGLDVFNETDEVFIDVRAASSAPAAFDLAELHRVLVESRPTHRVKAAL